MREREGVLSGSSDASVRETACFAIAWMSVFLLPVSPVVARNELYLYLPAFGLSLLAAQVIESSVDLSRRSRARLVRDARYSPSLGGCIRSSRSREMHDELVSLGAICRGACQSRTGRRHPARRRRRGDAPLLKDTVAISSRGSQAAAPDGRLIRRGSEQPDAPV
jgi:hypothetical protein